MQTRIEERVFAEAEWVIAHEATVRAAAMRFGVSKSTVHKDLTERLGELDRLLQERVRIVLEKNKAERHIRGGDATRRKYRGENEATKDAE